MDKKQWDEKDWKWFIGILFGIIVLLILLIIWIASYRLSCNKEWVNIISIGAGLVSIVLGIVAIIISTIQNSNSEELNSRMSETLARIDEKVNNVNDKLNINNIFTKGNNNYKDSEKLKKLTRVHAVIEVYRQMDFNYFIEVMNLNLKENETKKIGRAHV